jgi:hypothetical protein
MSDFARLMEMALANDPGSLGKLLGEPPPPLAEQMAANEAAAAKANQAQAAPPSKTSATGGSTGATGATATSKPSS